MKYKFKTGHYAVSLVRLLHWGLHSCVEMQCPWDLWRHPSALQHVLCHLGASWGVTGTRLLIRHTVDWPRGYSTSPQTHTHRVTSGLIIPPTLFCLCLIFQATLLLAPCSFWDEFFPSSTLTGSTTQLPFSRYSFHTSPSADHLHHPLHMPTQHVPFKLFLSYSQAPEARLSGAKHLYWQGGFWDAVQAQSPFTLPGGREMPALYQPYCEAHSQCTGPKGQQPCPFYFSGASSTAFEAQGDSAQWGFTYFNSSGDNHSPTEQKLEDSNMFVGCALWR